HLQDLVSEALRAQGRMVDAWRLLERAVADRIGLDLGDLRLAIAERAQRLGHGLVDDLEVTAARELLELHKRNVWLDARRVAIHDETDRPGRRDHRRLRIAIAVLLAKLERAIPGTARRRRETGVLERGVIERHGVRANLLIAACCTMRRAAVVADD